MLVQTVAGACLPALCYIAPSMVPGPPDPACVDRIVEPARAFGFPEWYLRRLESQRERP